MIPQCRFCYFPSWVPWLNLSGRSFGKAQSMDGICKEFQTLVRIDTLNELDYYATEGF